MNVWFSDINQISLIWISVKFKWISLSKWNRILHISNSELNKRIWTHFNRESIFNNNRISLSWTNSWWALALYTPCKSINRCTWVQTNTRIQNHNLTWKYNRHPATCRNLILRSHRNQISSICISCCISQLNSWFWYQSNCRSKWIYSFLSIDCV